MTELTKAQREELELIVRCQPDLLLSYLGRKTSFDCKLVERVFDLAKEQASSIIAAHPTEKTGADATANLSTETVDKPVQSMTAAARDVLAERTRQVEVEGFNSTHDAMNRPGTLAMASASYAVAASYASAGLFPMPKGKPPTSWPWDATWWKPGDARRSLVKAGALILAEIERIDRAARTGGKE